MNKAIFEGLVFDEYDNTLTVAIVGGEPFYVFDDQGFMRHIPAEEIDQQVWEVFSSQIRGNEDALSEQAAKMMGQEDIFSVAVIRNQLANSDKQFEDLQRLGMPADLQDYLGLMGFRVIVDHRGELLELKQPGIAEEGDE